MILRRHLDHALRLQYLQIEDPAELWSELHAKFDHQQTLFLPQARTNWTNIRVLDFPNFSAFNSELYRIIAQLRIYGVEILEAEQIEKTLSTFPPATAILSQQYRNMRFKKHSQLMAHLLLAEKHHQLLLRNAESRPAREVHTTIAIEDAEPKEPNGASGATAPVAGAGPQRDNPPVQHHAEVHVTEASRRPPRGSFRKIPPKWQNKPATGNPHKPRHFPPKHDHVRPTSDNCHKCGRKCHFAKDCRTSQYIVDMFRELQELRNKPRHNYHFEPSDMSDLDFDVENFMAIREGGMSIQDVALLDSASTHTILIKAQFFHFQSEKSWTTCKILTIAGSRTLRFREGRATIILPGGFPLDCLKAMYALDAPRSLISYRDLWARNIHLCTKLQGDEEVIELRQGSQIIATANAGLDGFYKVAIKPLASSPTLGDEEVCMAAWEGSPTMERNLAQGVSVDTKAAKPDIWHSRLGHPGTTIFRRMIPLIQGHTLTTADAGKMQECMACIQGKLIRRPSHWALTLFSSSRFCPEPGFT